MNGIEPQQLSETEIRAIALKQAVKFWNRGPDSEDVIKVAQTFERYILSGDG